MELNDSSRAAGSSHPAIPRSVFPGSLGKLLPLPAAQVPTRLSPPRQQANAAESADTAAESADTVPRAATAPVSKPAVFLVEPWTIQPVQTHRQHLLPTADFAGSADPKPTLPKQTLLPNLPTLSRGLPLPPPWLNQRCFVSVSPGRIFLHGLDSPSSSPCSSKNLRCRFSPTNLQLHKYALPIPPLLAWLPLPQSCPDQQSFLSSLGLSSLSRLTVSRFCRLCRFRRRCRFPHCPVSEPALFRQLFP